jgi:hypothetical protein
MATNKKTKPSQKRPERNNKGQFVNGNCGGPGGNPYAGYTQKFRQLLYDTVTDEEVVDLIRGQMRTAKSNPAAASLMLNYLIGKPKETVEISGADGDAIRVDIGGDLSDEEIKRIAGAVSAGRGTVK